MIVYVQGLWIPNTNRWDIDESWTFSDLISDVVKVVTSKTGDPSEFKAYVDGVEVPGNEYICDYVSDTDEVTITRAS